ncbi:hypothetical protein Dimus_037116 [Dionaea muscipula]
MGPIVEAEKSSIMRSVTVDLKIVVRRCCPRGSVEVMTLATWGFMLRRLGRPRSLHRLRARPIVSVPTVVVGPEMVPIQVTEEPHHALVSSSASSLRVVEEPAARGPLRPVVVG